MHIPEVKLELFRYIDNLENSKLLQIYEHLIKRNTNETEPDFWTTLDEWQKNDIEAGLTDLKHGKKRSFDEVMSKYE